MAPEIGSRETTVARCLLDADVERNHGRRGLDAAQTLAHAEALADFRGHEASEGIRYAGVADDEPRADAPAVGHAHADGAPVLDGDLRHLGVDEDPSPRGLDDGCDRGGDLRRAADRIPRALEIMLGDDGVHREAAL